MTMPPSIHAKATLAMPPKPAGRFRLLIAAAASAAFLSGCAPLSGQATDASAVDASLLRLVRDFTRAQQTFDQSRLAALTTESYFEISPIGEVDSRAKMLGFYAAENARPAPAMSVREEAIRRHGDFAIITSKLSYTVPGSAAKAREVSLRVSFAARRIGEEWRLVSAHYTPIRAVGPDGAR